MIEEFLGNERIVRIYSHLADKYSIEMFENRLLYTLTGNIKYGVRVSRMTEEGKNLYNRLKENKEKKIVMFGTGFWAKEIVKTNYDFIWSFYIDERIS